MQIVFKLIVVVVLTIFVLFSGLMVMRNQLIYVFSGTDAPPADMPRTRVVELPEFRDAPALRVWVTDPEPGQPVVLYFMGNTGSLSVHETRLREMADAGFGIAAMAYRGAGGQPGQPGQLALNTDALRVYAALDGLMGRPIGPRDRVIYGYSLGTGIAARLAAEQEELALILEAPFTRLCDVAQSSYSFIPGCAMFKGEEYETVGLIDKVGAPLLVLHGDEDDVVPLALGEAVFEAASQPKFMKVYPGGTHENLPRFGGQAEAISFVKTLRGAR